MAAAGKWKIYEQAKLEMLKSVFDLSAGTYNVALFLSTSNANTLAVNKALADLTNEVATAFGYTAGGAAIGGATVTNVTGTETFTANPVVWTAAGGSITARFAVLYKVGTFATIVNPLIAVCLVDATPADVTATTGNTLTVTINAGGIFTLSGATVD